MNVNNAFVGDKKAFTGNFIHSTFCLDRGRSFCHDVVGISRFMGVTPPHQCLDTYFPTYFLVTVAYESIRFRLVGERDIGMLDARRNNP